MIIATYNKETLPLDDVKISANDRAYLFGDAIYEVIRVYNRKPFLFREHMARLQRSLNAIGISEPHGLDKDILENIVVNDISEGMVYVQISRGSAPRSHSYFELDLSSNQLIYSTPFAAHPAEEEAKRGIFAITVEDDRWGRCDIKSVNLLPNCLSISKAKKHGAKEAILLRNDRVTEASSSNIFIVKNFCIKTPSLKDNILPGITRQFLIDNLRKNGYDVEETFITKSELFSADEVFISSTIKEALAVTKIDEHLINNGAIGDVATTARRLIIDAAYL